MVRGVKLAFERFTFSNGFEVLDVAAFGFAFVVFDFHEVGVD